MMLFVSAAPSRPVREPTNLIHFDDREFILFSFWKSGTPFGLIGSVLIVMLIGICDEAIRAFRLFMLRNAESTTPFLNDDVCAADNNSADSKLGFIKVALHSMTKRRFIHAGLYGAELTTSVVLILLLASFNFWIILAVILGRMVGYFIFNSSSPEVTLPTNVSVAYSTVVSPRYQNRP